MSIVGIIFFIFVLGIIVLVHELGHLIVAKRNGVYCHEFSIGMGPKIMKLYTDKTGTVYNIRALPLGGYVHMAGEDSGFEGDEKISDDLKFDNKKKFPRFKILVAGATMNFILGLVVYFIIGFFGGVTNLETNEIEVVKEVVIEQTKDEFLKEETPFYSAGIESGDLILSIDDVQTSNYTEITEALDNVSNDAKVTYLDQTDSKEKTTTVKKGDLTVYGISPAKESFHFVSSVKFAFVSFVTVIMQVFYGFYLLFSGGASISDMSGPIGIAVLSSGILELGWTQAVSWIAFLSINIGIINLLPIPALDGGRILFLLVELVRGKPINRELEAKLNNIVFIALIILLVFVTINDILNIDLLLSIFK